MRVVFLFCVIESEKVVLETKNQMGRLNAYADRMSPIALAIAQAIA